MEKLKLSCLSLGLLFSCAVNSADLPFKQQAVAEISQKEMVGDGFVHLRINVSSSEVKPESDIQVGEITVCSISQCFSSHNQTQAIYLSNTSGGSAARVIDIRIPRVDIRSIHFGPVSGTKSLTGAVQLSTALKTSSDFPAAEILVVANRATNVGNQSLYQPSFATGEYLSFERQSVFYNPKFATDAQLNLATKLSIPAGATTQPAIFSIAVHNTGEEYPLVDIYPNYNLRSPASITSTKLKNLQQNSNIQPLGASPQNSTTRVVPATGVIRLNQNSFNEGPTTSNPAQAQELATPQAVAAAVAAPTDACVNRLTRYASEINTKIATTGTVYIKGCTDVPPYVHIAISNNSDSRERLNISYVSAENPGPLLSLSKIESRSAGSQVAINGFTWVGDSGILPGKGLAKGFVQDGDWVKGSNRVGGGVVGEFDGNKIAFAITPGYSPRWNEGTYPPLFSSLTYPFVIVSSSTSVIKGGVCSTDTDTQPWSAIGTTPSNRIVYVSSASGYSTNASEMCGVLKALGANWGLRLDGNSATGMTVDGIRLNPLTGINALKVGSSSRYLAYVLRMAYRDWSQAPATPVIVEPERVPTPRNPCAKNPALCS